MTTAADARDAIGRHMLVDGFDLVLDTRASRGSVLVDARDGTEYLDLFTFFASSALGMNPPELAEDPAVLEQLGRVAVNKPSNSDLQTVELAAFVETFERVLGDPALGHLFLVDGGALAVENALKVAFDWKSRRNEAAGRDPALGTRVLHLERAFHGRSGYTMSLTNTDPVKTDRFPKLDWPRIPAPAPRLPVERVDELAEAERRALDAAEAAFAAHPHDIACVIAEPIQGEGGDRHLRTEFLGGLQELARAHDALFVLDEVQTGCGLTGSPWAYQQLGLEPDVVAFGKKLQVCGLMAGRRVDEVADNVFRVPSRINSTWGGNLTDIVRATHVLRVIEERDLIGRAATLGKTLLEELRGLSRRHDEVTNVRGRGLMCALDLPDGARRDEVAARLFDEERVMLLGSGTRTLRFRPTLTISEDELRSGVAAIDRVLRRRG